MDAGDTTLPRHMETAGRNVQYTSSVTQNEIINVICAHIQSLLVEKIRENQIFAILADEATDIHNKEQLPLVLRYVDGTRSIGDR